MPAHKYERPSTWIDSVTDRWRRIRRDLGVGVFSMAVAIATHTVFPILRWMQQRQIHRGETIWLDDTGAIPCPKV